MSPRKREFDASVALDAAMRVFWERGYEATSVQELVDRTGINRFSLYNTFGDKRALYLRACQRFGQLMDEQRLAALRAGDSAFDAIRTFFRLVVPSSRNDEPRGCLAIGTLMEKVTRDDPEIAAWAAEFLKRIEDLLDDALRRAQAAGEINDTADPQDLARYLVCVISGINVMAKAGVDPAQIESVAVRALDSLRPSRPPAVAG